VGAKFLAVAMLSWLTAGLQGVVNATIVFNEAIHNTMWIVGHFHHMALLNIGLVIFAVLYHMVPEMTGKKLYSNTLAKWHIWLTFWGQMLSSAYWMIDGLRGSPRRFAVPLPKYDTLNELAVIAVAILVVGQLLFVWNMWKTLQGAGGPVTDPENVEGGLINETKSIGPNANTGLALGTAVLTILASALMLTLKSGDEPATATPVKPSEPGLAVFNSNGCAGCHTLSAAGAAGSLLNLDQSKPTVQVATQAITNGRNAMPAFGDKLTEKQITDVATYIAENAGK
jgi:heme/copper-type cytochrome/quinol oxidase subunit 1